MILLISEDEAEEKNLDINLNSTVILLIWLTFDLEYQGKYNLNSTVILLIFVTIEVRKGKIVHLNSTVILLILNCSVTSSIPSGFKFHCDSINMSKRNQFF